MPEPVLAAEAAHPPLSTLTDDERLFRDSVRAFADEQVRPLVRAMDEDIGWAEWLQSILRDRLLLMEEKRLSAILLGSQGAGADAHGWDVEVPLAARRIAGSLLERYTMPPAL